MLKLKTVILAGILAFGFSNIFAQPDVRDSMILESKMLAPNMSGDPAFTVRLSITNKDSLVFMTWVCQERTIAGAAYALVVLGPGSTGRTFDNVIIPLTNTLRYFGASNFFGYNDASPDRFLLAAGFDPERSETIEPPNPFRKPIWELKFKSTTDAEGQVILDTGTVGNLRNTFTDTRPSDHTVNYLPGVLTIEYLKGDLNGDVMLTAADVAMILTCVFCAACSPPPVGAGACDLNCDGIRSPADVVLELNAVFLGEGFPC